jgi:hypothetical protein
MIRLKIKNNKIKNMKKIYLILITTLISSISTKAMDQELDVFDSPPQMHRSASFSSLATAAPAINIGHSSCPATPYPQIPKKIKKRVLLNALKSEYNILKLEEYSCFCDTDYVDQQLVEEAYKSLRAYYQNRRYSKQQTKQSKLQTISDARLAILDYINQHGIRSDFLT